MARRGRRGTGALEARAKRVPLALYLMLSAAVLALSGVASAETWRGLPIAPEYRCAPYDRDDYPYPQSVERRIIERLGGDLGFRAQLVHRRHWDANRVQMSTLLSIKTGRCPEDCAYCPESVRYDTGVEVRKLMDIEAVVARANRARAEGVTRHCMRAAWEPGTLTVAQVETVVPPTGARSQPGPCGDAS